MESSGADSASGSCHLLQSDWNLFFNHTKPLAPEFSEWSHGVFNDSSLLRVCVFVMVGKAGVGDSFSFLR